MKIKSFVIVTVAVVLVSMFVMIAGMIAVIHDAIEMTVKLMASHNSKNTINEAIDLVENYICVDESGEWLDKAKRLVNR